MKIKQKLKAFFAFKKNVFPNAKHRIIYAFTHGGVGYYKFDNAHGDLPYKRGIEAAIVYRELEMMCSFDYLKKWHAKAESIMNAAKFNMQSATQVQRLLNQLKERLTIPFEPSLGLKLASVVYFDATENPYEFDAKYAEEKIKRWGAGASVRDFFSQVPLMELIPFLRSSEQDILVYSQTIEAINKMHLDELGAI